MEKNSIPAKREFFMILGYKIYLFEQHLYNIRTIIVINSQAAKKTAKRLKLNPAFLNKLASREISLYGSGAPWS